MVKSSLDKFLDFASILSLDRLGRVLQLLLQSLHHGVVQVENTTLRLHSVHDSRETIRTLFLAKRLQFKFGCELGLHDFLVLAGRSDHGQTPVKIFIADGGALVLHVEEVAEV